MHVLFPKKRTSEGFTFWECGCGWEGGITSDNPSMDAWNDLYSGHRNHVHEMNGFQMESREKFNRFHCPHSAGRFIDLRPYGLERELETLLGMAITAQPPQHSLAPCAECKTPPSSGH